MTDKNVEVNQDEVANETQPNEVKPTESEQTISKTRFDKLATDHANLKKQLRAGMSDAERLQAERDELAEQLRIANLDKQKESLSFSLTAKGLTEEDAKKHAELLIDGDYSTAINGIIGAKDARITELQKEVDKLRLQTVTKPSGATSEEGVITKEKYRSMTIDQKIALKHSDPALYEQLAK